MRGTLGDHRAAVTGISEKEVDAGPGGFLGFQVHEKGGGSADV
ncbi:predicted protein [Streptomyces viridosporus ATCC 14672]|uniref:Predicted protein n=1 Tax=Streptomyces viridosporus (strain ATCC 14672 / DSM 40746 / JCM 4963 / KCTC 9882 / NRRL B-12104 / FH 1290) TaxID=566461 RepID=D5ZUY8_STRV1|nr:predicted protein [Streptomyces viridosporus ATCC 14672]